MNFDAVLKVRADVQGQGEIDGLSKSLGTLNKQADGVKGGLGNLNKQADGFKGGLGRMGQAVQGVGGLMSSLIPAAAIGGIAALGKRAIDTADDLNDMSQRTGVSVESLSRFGQAAADSGSSIEGVAKGMGQLAKRITDPGSAASKALSGIGIATTDAKGKVRNLDAVMLDISEKFAKMPDGAEKTALAMQLFGKSGVELIPMLNEGRAALEQYEATISGDMAKSADEFNDSLNAIGRSLSGPFNDAVTALLPAITSIAQGLVTVIKGFSNLPGPMQATILVIGGALTALVALAPAISALITIGTTIAGLFAAGGALAGAGTIIAGLATAFITLITGPVGIVALIVAAGVAIYTFRDQIGAAFKAVVDFIGNAFSKIGDLLRAGAQAYIDNYVKPVLKFFGDLFTSIGAAVSAGFQKLVSIIRGAANAYIDNYVKPVVGFFGNLFNYVATAVSVGFQRLVSIISSAANAYIDYYAKPVIEFFGDLFDNIRAAVTVGFNRVIEIVGGAAAQFKRAYIDPVLGLFKGLYDNAVRIFQNMGTIIGNAFNAVVNTIKAVFRSVLQYLASRVNTAAGLINILIAAFNRLPAPDIPLIPRLTVPAFAQGGVVSRPTLAMVGEGGEREYIVPESKMAAASANYLAGARGDNVLAGATAGSAPVINVTTGPVMEFNGERYVTVADMERAMRATANGVIGRLRTPSARIALGMAR